MTSAWKPDWIMFVTLMVIGSLGFHILSRYARDGVDVLWFAVILNGAAFAVCSIIFLIFRSSVPVQISSGAVMFALLSGASIGIANCAAFGMYKAGLPVSIAVPMTRTAVAIGAVVLGIILFSEKLNPANLAGIALSLVSIYLMTL